MPFTPASAAPPSILHKREIHRCCDARNCPQPDLAGLPSGPCLDANGLAKGETAIREFCFEPVAQPAVAKSVDGEQLEMPKRMQLAVVISGSMIGREENPGTNIMVFHHQKPRALCWTKPKVPKANTSRSILLQREMAPRKIQLESALLWEPKRPCS